MRRPAASRPVARGGPTEERGRRYKSLLHPVRLLIFWCHPARGVVYGLSLRKPQGLEESSDSLASTKVCTTVEETWRCSRPRESLILMNPLVVYLETFR